MKTEQWNEDMKTAELIIKECGEPVPAWPAGFDLIDKLRRETAWLRELLWFRHGCEINLLYGDDGEMQCGRCMIDFKRDSPDDIQKKFEQINVAKMRAK